MFIIVLTIYIFKNIFVMVSKYNIEHAKRREMQDHAAILQHATRRKLSLRRYN